ncbi:TRAP transporter large permease [Pseudoxanthomonas mexicana]|jgi:tripartite ATP-independent transporter DctM subunit|uniref:TRAP transporter large permease protein n=1 Tax=Pseudoxanthomonas mexicana TaxID=128785 RepID=A0ABX6R932_PSEMX|nr:TRAP transporter large permease [Pseudoxanthomonas mexicana]QLQ27229.1 MAG: TRAP transporter large permease [Pseudoxanthomonas sp.]QND79778.1 TRAP transporter large permease [Pseudoxanthomonas mexicana]UOV00573.1 TRAP transporter large permease [Pseudoxanthomonas mexicana]
MAITLLFSIFAILLLIGVPVAYALAAASLATLLYLDLPSIVLVQQISSGTGSASLIAIPLFIFAGEIMLRGGISERLISLAASLVGRLRGGLGQVSILSSLFFGGVSGSAIADVSAVGGTMIPQMVKRGYDRDFAVNVSITAALVALLVPPSHNLILFSAAAGGGLSIADLFAAGIVPALLMTIVLMFTGWAVACKRGYGTEPFPGLQAVLLRLVSALPGLGLVGLIFFGIRAGIFTAVESAAIAVVYALLVTSVLYRQLSLKEFFATVTHAARTTGVILFVIATAAVFGWLLAYLQVPAAAVEALQSIAHSKYTVLLLIILVLLVLGTFMDLAPMILICTPIFLPVARAYGIDPIHFGLVLVLTGGIGLVTPPVGSVLFIGTAIGKITIAQSMRTIWPFWLAGLAVLLVVALFPDLSLWLPRALKG